MQQPAPRRRLSLAALLVPTLVVVVLLVAAPPAAAGQSGRLETTHASVWNGPPVLGAGAALPADGMRAAIDPESGELRRPTAAEALTLDLLTAPPLSRLFAASQVERADGTVMMAVDSELFNYSVLRLDAGGAASFACVDGSSRAAELTHAAAAPAAAEVK